MCKSFDNPTVSTAYCFQRDKDLKALRASLKDCHRGVTETDLMTHSVTDLGYCRVHVQIAKDNKHQEVWVCDKLGNTKVSGSSVTVSQVLAFILRTYW